MSNYRRTSKPKTEHIKKGFTVFQKTVATIASILGLITASITIMNALDNNKNTKKEPTTSQTTTIIKVNHVFSRFLKSLILLYHETELATRKDNSPFFKIFLKKCGIISFN